MRHLLAAVVVTSLVLAGCASRRPPAAALRDDVTARAEALLAEGCYRCLEEALALAEPRAASARDRRVAFGAAVLLAARDRELGTKAADHLPAARALAPPGERGRLLLEIVEALPWPSAANGPDSRDRALLDWRRLAPIVPAWHAALSALPAEDLASRYLLATVSCTWSHLLPPTAPPDGPPVPPPAGERLEPPALEFRALLCDRRAYEDLVHARERLARHEELELLLGDVALAGGALLTAERHYRAAWQAFPAMLPAAHGLARVHVMLEEYESSVPEYDAVLAAVPDQQDSLLGKARALSQLGRHAEAVPLLDRLIALGTWLVADAHYWRGWNRLQLGQVDGAWTDAELALTLMVNARVHVLAGAVAARRDDWPRARAEFEAALPLDESDCDIPVSLGSVLGHEREWAAAFASYARAAECLVGSQAQLARRLDEIASAPMDDARRARFLARTRKAAEAARRQEGQSRYNAAVSLANAGRGAEAKTWAEQATAWAEWKERAEGILRRGQ